MDLTDPGERETLRSHLGEIFTDRPVIFGFGPLAGYTSVVSLLHSVGARKPLLVVTGRGAGPVPDEDQIEVVSVDAPGSHSMTEELRQHDHLARHLPGYVKEAVDRYDPTGEGVWFVSPFVVNDPVLGRRVFGGRPADWLALEDKLIAEQIWAAIGFPHARSRIVEVRLAELRDAQRDLDDGAGAVWTGDARGGFNGGGDFVRWVVTPEDAQAAFVFFEARCDRVRVMPFLEGVPCSIHGIVLPDGTATFRPVELAILRHTDSRRFVYGGQGTFWDPPDADRARMRDLVRATGAHLRERAGYAGAFGIDGIMTGHGFRPTEINTRMPGGLTAMATGVDISLFLLLQANLVAGRAPGVSTRELEGWAVRAFDERRVSKPLAISEHRLVEGSQEIALRWDGERLRRSDEDTGMSLVIGPSVSGTYAKIEPGTLLRVGMRIAPLNVALMRLLDDEFGATFGPVTAASDVRR